MTDLFSTAILAAYNVTLGFICAFGLIGNLVVVMVICTQSSGRSVTSLYLANLAIADALHLLSIPPLIHTSNVGSWIWGDTACKVYYLLHYANWTVSIFIITAMSFDRYKAVISPFNSERFRNKSFAACIVICLWILAAFVMIPVYAFAHTAPHEFENQTKLHCIHANRNESFDENHQHYLVQTFFNLLSNPIHFMRFLFVIGCLIPGILLLYFYALILRKLYEMKMARGTGSQAHQRFETVTILVAAVVAFYLICCVPHWVHVMILLTFSQGFTFATLVSSHITSLLVYMNSAGNPVLYAFLNEPFRSALRSAFTLRQRTPAARNSIRGMNSKKRNCEPLILHNDVASHSAGMTTFNITSIPMQFAENDGDNDDDNDNKNDFGFDGLKIIETRID